ncbi:putative fluoride ion transporter CrcB [Litorimonas cladophorae]|uniref:Fluoride-specific ion channel FluC n=1 Tax=Litorimonas cladophorae TaxID=1220491 RepID=A0A918KH15_9PROT|nr:CrcB family protein [Litorimonas cladophorae]GGX62371.1 putative fluoride ion transporter CrcB [Litorimonas cladophorae]
MSSFLTVALGGALGASARHGIGLAASRWFGAGFPVGTLFCNVLGGLLMGLLVGWLIRDTPDHADTIRLFAGVGILGGFTTFSAFSLEAMRMIEMKAYGPFIGYVSASVLLSILAVALGLILMRGTA